MSQEQPAGHNKSQNINVETAGEPKPGHSRQQLLTTQ